MLQIITQTRRKHRRGNPLRLSRCTLNQALIHLLQVSAQVLNLQAVHRLKISRVRTLQAQLVIRETTRRNAQLVVNRINPQLVTNQLTSQRLNKRITRRAQTLIQTRKHKATHITTTRTSRLNNRLILRRMASIRVVIPRNVITRQTQIPQIIKSLVILHKASGVISLKTMAHRLRHPIRVIELTRRQLQVAALLRHQTIRRSPHLRRRLALSVRTSTTHQMVTHQRAPILRLLRNLKSTQGRQVTLQLVELLRVLLQTLLRNDAQVSVLIKIQSQLRLHITKRQVKRGRSQKQNTRLITRDILLNGTPHLRILITQIMRLITNHQLITRQIRQLSSRHRIANHLTHHVILAQMLIPHLLQVLRAQHQNAHILFVLQHRRHSNRSQSLTQTHHVTQHRATTAHQTARQRMSSRFLIIHQHMLQTWRKRILLLTKTSVLRQLVADLHIHVIRVSRLNPRLINQINNLAGNIKRRTLTPQLLKPILQLRRMVRISQLNIELQIRVQTRTSKVRRTHKTHHRMHIARLRSVRNIRLTVQRLLRVHLHLHTARLQMLLQSQQSLTTRRACTTSHQLTTQMLNQLITITRTLIILRHRRHRLAAHLCLRLTMHLLRNRTRHHTQQNTSHRSARLKRSLTNLISKLIPRAQVHIARRNIQTVIVLHRAMQRVSKLRAFTFPLRKVTKIIVNFSHENNLYM